jgi:hypothetical protein
MFWKKKKREREEKKEDWKPKTPLQKVWYFIWYDDSIWSWIVNVLLAYLLIKFIFYPLLGLIMGTTYPIVAVVSTSMVHADDLDGWWAKNEDYYLGVNITKADFEKYPFKNGFNKGDLMILIGKDPEDIKIGDVIVFQSRKPYPIIHRVVKKDYKGMWVFETKGDNNKLQIRDLELDETRVLEKTVLGKAVLRIPWLGYVKIWAVNGLQAIGVNFS